MFGTILVGLIGTIGFVFMTIFYIPLMCFMEEKQQKKFARRELARFSKFMLRVMGAKVEVIYKDKKAIQKLNRKEGIVVIGNHQSNMDIPLLMGHLPFDLGFVAKHEMEKWPLYSLWMKKSNCVFLNRTNPREAIKSIKKAVKIIKAGYPTVVFPEGARSLDGKIDDFKKGSFRLATDTNGIIVPVTIDGTFDIQRRGRWKVNFNKKVKLTINEPIFLEGLSTEDKKNLNNSVKNIIEDNYGRY